MSFETLVERSTSESLTYRLIISRRLANVSFGRVFHRNGAAKENERFPVSRLTDSLKRVTTDVERVDLWLVGMVIRRRR